MGFNPEIQNYRNRHESYIRNYYITIILELYVVFIH